jgi:NAD(P)-dependent dehydrogenase (short-subunit alcohol dehydrogenase family)
VISENVLHSLASPRLILQRTESAEENAMSETMTMPKQHQTHQPGSEAQMHPKPISEPRPSAAQGRRKLENKVALITGGDSGIGRAVALAYAAEGAKVVIAYLDEHEDARETSRLLAEIGGECHLIAGDVGSEPFCKQAVATTIAEFGKLDILVNNAGWQEPCPDIEKLTEAQLEKTFRTNIFSMFFMVKAAMPYLVAGARIINTASVTAYKGSSQLLDYSATKGAIVAFTRSLAQQLIKDEIHVNAVAPGPIWTPLIPATFTEEQISHFGANVPMQRPGQPNEVAPAYVFLASEGASYMSGQVLHPNGGEVVNS